ncbi:MAG TPA: pseudouridine synthase [Myxococcota bacterium]|nr:pseudouridine synthase [Myxococcota bacterium]
MRLQRILAAAGISARRGAEALIRAGRVRVNGRPAKLGDRADPWRDVVTLDGEPLRPQRPVAWMLHKPRGVLSSVRDPEGRPTVLALVPERAARIFPVGRLDRDSEGLLLLTNDGVLAHALLHPSHEVEREYEVVVRGALDAEKRARLARGVRLEDGWTAPARVSRAQHEPRSDTTRFHLILQEGRKRQIRRALQALGHPVRELRRVRFGPLRLGGLARGAARRLDASERRALEELAERVLSRAGDAQAARSSGAKPGRRKRKRRSPRGPRFDAPSA